MFSSLEIFDRTLSLKTYHLFQWCLELNVFAVCSLLSFFRTILCLWILELSVFKFHRQSSQVPFSLCMCHLFIFWDRVFLCDPSCLQAYSPPALGSCILGLLVHDSPVPLFLITHPSDGWVWLFFFFTLAFFGNPKILSFFPLQPLSQSVTFWVPFKVKFCCIRNWQTQQVLWS